MDGVARVKFPGTFPRTQVNFPGSQTNGVKIRADRPGRTPGRMPAEPSAGCGEPRSRGMGRGNPQNARTTPVARSRVLRCVALALLSHRVTCGALNDAPHGSKRRNWPKTAPRSREPRRLPMTKRRRDTCREAHTARHTSPTRSAATRQESRPRRAALHHAQTCIITLDQ